MPQRLLTLVIALLCTVLISLLCAQAVFAQSFVADTLKDATTYVPMVTFYTAERLDWNSSQPHFARGAIEVNPQFTQSGRPFSAPLSYGDGNRKIVRDALQIGALSLANNAVMHLMERHFADTPERHAAWKRLSRLERFAFASALAFESSRLHFAQWQTNISPPR
jgi:hypothetical protein